MYALPSEYPLTSEKYISWVKNSLQDSEVLNLFMNYEVIGYYNNAQSGIFDFYHLNRIRGSLA